MLLSVMSCPLIELPPCQWCHDGTLTQWKAILGMLYRPYNSIAYNSIACVFVTSSYLSLIFWKCIFYFTELFQVIWMGTYIWLVITVGWYTVFMPILNLFLCWAIVVIMWSLEVMTVLSRYVLLVVLF